MAIHPRRRRSPRAMRQIALVAGTGFCFASAPQALTRASARGSICQAIRTQLARAPSLPPQERLSLCRQLPPSSKRALALFVCGRRFSSPSDLPRSPCNSTFYGFKNQAAHSHMTNLFSSRILLSPNRNWRPPNEKRRWIHDGKAPPLPVNPDA